MSHARCKNCDNVIHDKFCSHCGQRTSVEVLSTKKLLKDVFDNIFQINHGLFFSIVEFSIRPASSINAYLNGQRKRYFQPIAYAFTLATLFYLVSKIVGHSTFVDQIFMGYTLSVEDKQSAVPAIYQRFIQWFSDNYAYTTLLLIPLYAFSTFAAFYSYGKGFLEHIVLNLYITGHQSLIYALVAIVGVFITSEDVTEIITLILSVTYASAVMLSFFNTGHIIIRIVRVCLSYFILVILLMFVLGLTAIISQWF